MTQEIENDNDNESQDTEADDNPGVKEKHAGGRPPASWYKVDAQLIMNGVAGYAARVLEAHIKGIKGSKTLKPSLQRACEYVIDHSKGKARQKIEHSGGIMTYSDLAKSADNLDKKPRDIVADVEELAHKHQEKLNTGTDKTGGG